MPNRPPGTTLRFHVGQAFSLTCEHATSRPAAIRVVTATRNTFRSHRPMEFLKQIETLFRTGTAGGLTDGQLLERFLERRDEDAEAAFAALVDRHGAMVLRVCRQILR